MIVPPPNELLRSQLGAEHRRPAHHSCTAAAVQMKRSLPALTPWSQRSSSSLDLPVSDTPECLRALQRPTSLWLSPVPTWRPSPRRSATKIRSCNACRRPHTRTVLEDAPCSCEDR